MNNNLSRYSTFRDSIDLIRTRTQDQINEINEMYVEKMIELYDLLLEMDLKNEFLEEENEALKEEIAKLKGEENDFFLQKK